MPKTETYEAWYRRMNGEFVARYGLSLSDMVDFHSRDIYESGGEFDDVIEDLREQDELFDMMLASMEEE